MTEKRLRKGPRGTVRRPRCEDIYPSVENPSRTRFRTSDNVLFDVADTAVTPSRVMTRIISEARRAAEKPLRIEPPPALLSLSDSGTSQSATETCSVSLRHDPHLLSNVAAEPLEVALQYCYFHTSPDRLEMNQANRTAWDNEFVRVSPRRLCELASAAYYLDICDLVDLTCRAIAAIISGKTADQIRTTFHIENDLVQTLVFPPKLNGTARLSQPQKRRIESKKVSSASLADDLADSDEQDSRQAANPRSIPRLGRNTVEEVENWINGDGNSKKTSKKRRKKKKNKTSHSSPDCSAVEPTSLSTSAVDIRSSTSSGELPADDSLALSSPINAHAQLTEQSDRERPVPSNSNLLPAQSETQPEQGCPTLICTSSSSNDDVALVCMGARQEVGRAKARMSASSRYANSCDERGLCQSAEPSSPPSSPPPADVSQRIINEESKAVPKGLVWSAVSDDHSDLVYHGGNQRQQGHTSPERPLTGIRSGDETSGEPESISSKALSRLGPRIPNVGEGDFSELIASKAACGREQRDKLCAIVYNEDHVSSVTAKGSTKSGPTTVSLIGVGLGKDYKSGFHLGYDSAEKNQESTKVCNLSEGALKGQSITVDTEEVQSSHSGVGNTSYIRCPTRMDKEVEDFENRLRIGDDEAEPNVFHASQQSETLLSETLLIRRTGRPSLHQSLSNSENNVGPEHIDNEDLVQVDLRAGEPAKDVFIQNRLRAVRREAQLVEREKHLQQRVEALDKQITNLRVERESVRSELSLVVRELEQYREETDL